MEHRARTSLFLGLAWAAAVACSATNDGERQAAAAPFDAASLARGAALVEHLGCTACHVAANVAAEPAPRLDQVGARLLPSAIERAIADPAHATRRATMPDVLSPLSAEQRAADVRALTQFLVSRGGPLVDDTREIAANALERGRQLYHSLGCVACHAPLESPDDLAVPLWDLKLELAIAPNVDDAFVDPATKYSFASLAAWLVDPVASHPSGRMPSFSLTHDEAQALAFYLARSRVPSDGIRERRGWSYRYYEGEFTTAEPGFQGAKCVRTGELDEYSKLPEHRDDHFAFEFEAFVDVAKSGNVSFFTTSDDGSRVYVDGKLVVDNEGMHPATTQQGDVWLEKGRHGILVTYFEFEGGEELSIEWKPTGGERGVIPAAALAHWSVRTAPLAANFAVDAGEVARGAELFGSLGCANCHALEAAKGKAQRPRAFSELAAHDAQGCLADSPRGAAPRFALDARARADVRARLEHADRLDSSATAKLAGTFERFQCLACHRRGDVGGPSEALQPYFKPAFDVDLGNEGRFPPQLTALGSKLRGEWLAKFFAANVVERPYLATRMPRFGADNAREWPTWFAAVDTQPQATAPAAFDEKSAEIGRKLAGKSGLGCIQCHYFAGTRSLGIPAIDLAHVAERLQPSWFRKLLLDPKSVGMNSRMPIFWTETDGKKLSPARDVLEGDPERQVDALWSYLSLGRAMPLPDGIQVKGSEFELAVGDDPVMCGVFWAGASPRTIVVGYPERANLAFDVENSRLVCAWRGRFFNAEGTWSGRAGGLEHPFGEDVLAFAEAPTFAQLERADAPWPTALGRDGGFARRGWTLDARRRPVFRYALGAANIGESFQPELAPGGTKLVRRFDIDAAARVSGLYALLATAKTIRADGAAWHLDGGATMRVLDLRAKPYVVATDRRAELRVPIELAPDGARFGGKLEVEVSW